MRRDRCPSQYVELLLSTVLLVLLAVSLTVAGIHLERAWYAQDVAADEASAAVYGRSSSSGPAFEGAL